MARRGKEAPKRRVSYHEPVLLDEVLNFLKPEAGKKIIDATAGGGGHTLALLKTGAHVLGIDRDPDAIKHIKNRIQARELTLKRGNFSELSQIAKEEGFEKADGIIFDLGVASRQLENKKRGFSFRKRGPLDMRMDPSLTVRAYDIVNNFEERRLYEIFKTYGQEKFSRSIASAIYGARKVKAIETTTELAAVIEKAKRGVRKSKIHEATKVFQALRIVVNSEILNLEQALPQTAEILKPGGRLVIISFHSLEDGLVKRFFKQERRFLVLTKKPIGPSQEEIERNPRSRSAKLRAAERI